MSSSMLEQAVIDAQALKEAAMRNAEQEVLDKYAGEIKEAVDTLLEQEDPMADPMAAMGDPMMDPTAIGGEDIIDKITDKLSLKALEDEEGVTCPGKEGKVVLDLDSLEVALGISDEQPEEIEAVEEDVLLEASDDDLQDLLDEDEEIELNEDSIKDAIEEILKVDMENVPRGHLGTTHPTKAEQIFAVEVAASADEDTVNIEDTEEFQKALKKLINLEEHVKTLKSEKNRLVKDHNELKSIARQVSGKLTELNITNSKLVYQNRILKSSSLNERQKQKLVEAVSKANSTEEAKVIYETLQESLTSRVDNSPQNLNEAVSKNNRLVLKSSNKETQVSNSASERMKKLAGII